MKKNKEIEEILLKEDYHIIVTFKDGTIKDVNAMDLKTI